MQRSFRFQVFIGLFVMFVMASGVFAQAPSKQSTILPRDADVEGLKIHYLTAGKGPAVILLHGYTQTSRMWRPIIPLLCREIYRDCAGLARNRGLRHPERRVGHEELGYSYPCVGQIAGR
jgi:hypothetical protein